METTNNNLYTDVVEYPPLGDAAVNHLNNPEFFTKWANGQMEEFKNIPHENVVKVVFYSDTQDPTLEPNRCVVIYKDYSMLLLTLQYHAEMATSRVVTYAATVDQESTTVDEVTELKV